MKTYFAPVNGEFVIEGERVKVSEIFLHRQPGVIHRHKGVTTCVVGKTRMVVEYMTHGNGVTMTIKPLGDLIQDESLHGVLEEMVRMHQLRKFVGSNGGCVTSSIAKRLGISTKVSRKLVDDKAIRDEAMKLMAVRNNYVILVRRAIDFSNLIRSLGESNA